jgi:hypothetical protein
MFLVNIYIYIVHLYLFRLFSPDQKRLLFIDSSYQVGLCSNIYCWRLHDRVRSRHAKPLGNHRARVPSRSSLGTPTSNAHILEFYLHSPRSNTMSKQSRRLLRSPRISHHDLAASTSRALHIPVFAEAKERFEHGKHSSFRSDTELTK